MARFRRRGYGRSIMAGRYRRRRSRRMRRYGVSRGGIRL